MSEFFKKAVPVWAENRENDKNLRVQFKAVTAKADKITVKLATSGIYNLSVNGSFVAYGPARAGRGHFRVDEIDITPYARFEKNVVVIEVCGYNVCSYYVMKQPSFLTAEIVSDGEISAFTSASGSFSARINPEYIREIQRYSFQRPFAESYRISENDTYFTDLSCGGEALSEFPEPVYLNRNTPYPDYERITAKRILSGGFTVREKEDFWKNGAFDSLVAKEKQSDYLFPEPKFMISREYERLAFSEPLAGDSASLADGTYGIYELSHNATGIIGIKIKCSGPLRLYIAFDEVLSNGRVDYTRGACCNAAIFDIPAGGRDLRLFEVYTCKYIKAAVSGGAAELLSISVTEFKRPAPERKFAFSDSKVQLIADAAIETFRQGSVDLFMDCPSRERAGWLCDSFFSGRTEALLYGNTPAEHDFLENFLCEENYVNLPNGMLPMCYPADHTPNSFIPNWAMWLFLELLEYRERSGDTELAGKFRKKAEGLVNYFKRFENEDGLLENLESWVFVEWSRANDLTDGVNYPSNMLYAEMLCAIAELYGLSELGERAEKIRETVYRQSFDGSFFRDHAVRRNGKLTVCPDRTEVCQYYAFFFGVADKTRNAELLNTLINDFGPARNAEKTYPEIAPANAFIGNYLRLEILMREGYYRDALENIVGFFSSMAERTGTLWENMTATASCNHCFASYVICWLNALNLRLGGI